MAFVDMNSIDFYQPSTRADLPSKRRPAALSLGVSMASRQSSSGPTLGQSIELSERLPNYDLIEFLDMSGPAPKESFDPFCEPATELNGGEVDAGGKITCSVSGWTWTNDPGYLVRTRYHLRL